MIYDTNRGLRYEISFNFDSEIPKENLCESVNRNSPFVSRDFPPPSDRRIVRPYRETFRSVGLSGGQDLHSSAISCAHARDIGTRAARTLYLSIDRFVRLCDRAAS